MKKLRGKVVGALLGLAAGGPIGAAFGIIIGHIYDRHPATTPEAWADFTESYRSFTGTTQQATFTIGVIVLGAKMAKADGRVTRQEIEAFKRVFNVTSAQEDHVGKLFNQARLSASGFEPYAFQLSHAFRRNPEVLEEVLGGLFMIAAADSAGLSPAEIDFLKRVAVIFDFSSEDFERIAARAGIVLPGHERYRDNTQEAYEVLGLHVTATDVEIKATYRALIRKHHPDRLVAQGLPPEFVAIANEKMKRINGAYDTICRLKGIK
jgi:DnaJ like chaperone protein